MPIDTLILDFKLQNCKRYILFFFLINFYWSIVALGFPGSSPAMQEMPVRFLGWEDPLEVG